MTTLNGLYGARMKRAQGIDVPVPVMTAVQWARSRAKEMEADGFIAMPFHLIALLNSVERYHETS